MSGCFYGPFISDDIPVNCAAEVYEWENFDGASEAPIATVMRNNAPVDVTGTIEDLGVAAETVDIYTVDCDGNPVAHQTTTEAFHHWKFTLAGANEGETLYVNGNYHGPIQAAGTCSTTPLDPAPQCSGMYDWSVCQGNGSGSGSDTNDPTMGAGCSASGGMTGGAMSVLVGLALFGATRRRRR